MCASPSIGRLAVMLAVLVFRGVVCAEDAAPRRPNLYDGAVGVQLDEITEKSITRVNTETMENAPWSLVRARVEQLTGMQVRVDEEAMTDCGIDLNEDTIIPQWLAGETVTYLGILLTRQMGNDPFAWYVQEGLLTLTTQERAYETYVTRQYPIGDLLSNDCDPVAIIVLLGQTTSGPWDADEPGTGTISEVGNQLFIRQTHRMHQEIAEILAGLRRQDPVVLTNCSTEDLRLRRLLEEKRISFEFLDNTLKEVFDWVQAETGIKFRLDSTSLTDAGLDADSRLGARAVNLPLHIALQQMLSSVNGTKLTVRVSHEECLITTAERANEMYETVLYRVGPLGMTGERLNEFVAMLEHETSGPWDADEPGTGTIAGIEPRSILAVRQTQRVHREILEILRGLKPSTTTAPLATARPVAAPVAHHSAAISKPAGQVHAVAATASLPQSVRKSPTTAETWEIIEGYAPLLLALLLGCATGYFCRH